MPDSRCITRESPQYIFLVCCWTGGVCPCGSGGQCDVLSSSAAHSTSAGCQPHSACRAWAPPTSACRGATGSIWCFTNRKVILRSCQHPSASITHRRVNTHGSAAQPHAHTHGSADTAGSAAHKAVNNRKWYVVEKVSAQLDSANTALFFHSSFIFTVHVDTSSIFCAQMEVFFLLHLKPIWVADAYGSVFSPFYSPGASVRLKPFIVEALNWTRSTFSFYSSGLTGPNSSVSSDNKSSHED